jgi:signal transduction histidine kinase
VIAIRKQFRLPKAAATPESRGRLSDFCFAGRLAPITTFLVVAAAFYAWKGWSEPTIMLVKLWAGYSAAYLVLATLARFKGRDADWTFVLPAAIGAVALGGITTSLVALAPRWDWLLNVARAGPEWSLGAAFSAFLVGLSLVTSEMRRREQVAADSRRQLLEARLKTLTAQIEPHFMMNTLANLRYLIKADSSSAAKMLDHLADFLQGALERARATNSTLGQELDLVESYLSIMRIRMGERLRYTTDVPADLRELPFPPLLLQTLVENAVTHGIEPSGTTGVVSIVARRENSAIVVSVTDDGVGIANSTDASRGFGLRNTRERLETFYGGRASLALAAHSPSGTVAAISIPASTTAASQ